MSTSRFTALSRTAAKLAMTAGVRDSGEAVVGGTHDALRARFVFLAAPREDSTIAELIASTGLAAADYRRLESRLARSPLWSMFVQPQPLAIDNLRNDPRLHILAFSTRSSRLISVPVIFRGKCAAILVAGFEGDNDIGEAAAIEILETFSSLFAHALRVEQAAGDERRKLADENRRLKQALRERFALESIIGRSAPIRVVLDRIANIARSNTPVLLRGEHGTGKDLFANAIHFSSLRSSRPFIKLDTSTVASEQAVQALFSSADGGTIFIEDVAELSESLCSYLLTVMDAPRSVRSELDTNRLPNVRVIAATRSLAEEHSAANYPKRVLFDRLSHFAIIVPPLRDRPSDVLLLAEHFVAKYQKALGKNILRISTPAIDMLAAYHFPGNVRELENVIEKAVAACDGNVIHGRHLPPTLQTAEESGTASNVTLASAVAAFEKDLIQDALKSTRGNIAKAAAMLDTTERILGYKIRKYAIDARRFKR